MKTAGEWALELSDLLPQTVTDYGPAVTMEQLQDLERKILAVQKDAIEGAWQECVKRYPLDSGLRNAFNKFLEQK